MTAAPSSKTDRRGLFISFEGGDGVGKSTQIARLAKTLRKHGREVVETREPGGSAGAEAIRALIVTGDEDRWSAMSEALLMYAARRDHLEKTIRPARNRGAVVLCDRFADSTMAYQGYAGGLGAETLAALYASVIGDEGPDLTFLLDAPGDEGLARAAPDGSERRFEEKGAAFQSKVREAFLEIAKNAPERCVIVDARGSKDAVAERIEQALREHFPALFGG